MGSKVCSQCGIDKSLNDYYKTNKVKSNGEEYIYYHPYCKKCDIEKSKIWISNNRRRHTDNVNRYYRENPVANKRHIAVANEQRRVGYNLAWQRANKDKIKQYNINHQPHDINKKEWESCLEYFKYKCAYCGMSQDDAKEKYNNYLHKEHVDHEGSNDLSNCIPACKGCNSSKGKKLIEDWYNSSRDGYSVYKINKINRWIKEDYREYIKD